MKKELINKTSLDDHAGCFGNFNIEDPICKKLCAIRIRCAVERDYNTRLDILEDLVFYDDTLMIVQ